MFTIGQFAKICNISPKALRHYEKIGLLLPSKVDGGNQYRYYSRELIPLVMDIHFLRELSLPLKLIQHIISGKLTPEEITRILSDHRNQLITEISNCNTKLFKLNHWKQYQEAKKMKPFDYCVGLQTIPPMHARAIRKVSTDFPADIQSLYETILNEMSQANVIPAGAPMIVYYDQEFNPEKVDFEAAWPVNDTDFANQHYSGFLAAVCTHVGPYDQLCHAYEAIFSWMNEHGYKPAGPMRDAYPNDPASTPPEKLITQIIVPVEKIS